MAPVFKKVVQSEGEGLTEAERAHFAAFVLMMSNRTPRNFDIADFEYKGFVAKTTNDYIGNAPNEELREIYDKTRAENPDWDVSFEQAKGWMLEGLKRENIRLNQSAGLLEIWSSFEMLPTLMSMDWKFWVPAGGEFITSDDPVVSTIQTPHGTEFIKGGWMQPTIQVTLPLAPRLCFVATWGGGSGRRMLTARSVPLINKETITMSQRYAYANQERTDLEEAMQERDKLAERSPEPYRISGLF